jgi:hypothetical protein
MDSIELSQKFNVINLALGIVGLVVGVNDGYVGLGHDARPGCGRLTLTG